MKVMMTELRTYKIELICDCNGTIEANGHVLETNPPVYAHQCLKCEKVTTHNQEYPTTQEVEVGEPQEVPFEGSL